MFKDDQRTNNDAFSQVKYRAGLSAGAASAPGRHSLRSVSTRRAPSPAR